MLSVSLTLPVVTLNYFVWWIGWGQDRQKEGAAGEGEKTLFVACIMTSFFMFTGILVTYFFSASFRCFTGIVAIWELVYMLAARRQRLRKKDKKT